MPNSPRLAACQDLSWCAHQTLQVPDKLIQMSMRALSGQFASSRTPESHSQASSRCIAAAQPPSRKRARLSCARDPDHHLPQLSHLHEIGISDLQEATPPLAEQLSAAQADDVGPVHLVPYPQPQNGGSGTGLMANPVTTTGLSRSLQSGGVHATARFDLPSPATAVRNLVEQAQLSYLCTTMSSMHHRRAAYPFSTVVDFAVDGAGQPIFCLSPLAIHTRNLTEDPRCSMVVQLPGWTSLANARVTVFGDVYRLPPEMQSPAREIFLEKQASDRTDRWVSANSIFFRMHRILDIFFVGGFGTVQWVDPAEYASSRPDAVVADKPHTTLQALNERFSGRLLQQLGKADAPVEEAVFISIDRTGADVRLRKSGEYCVQRLGFQHPVHNLEEALSGAELILGRP